MSPCGQLLPTKEILHVCDLIEESIRQFFETRDTHAHAGGYEAQDEAHLMLLYCIRCLESICILARENLLTLPAVQVIARTISEVSIKATWMVYPGDLFECEARWLTFATEESAYYEKTAKMLDLVNAKSAETSRNEGKNIKQFYERVKMELNQRFPDKYKVLKQPPSVREMLKELNVEPQYWKYVYGSQFTHGSLVATSLYRRNYGVDRQFGEFMELGDWVVCFEMSWGFFEQAARHIFFRYGTDPDLFYSAQQHTAMVAAIHAIK